VFDLNPVYHVIEVARTPLLSGTLPWTSLAVVVALSAIGVLLSRAFYSANRELVIYRWVA
jgi:lipopolysaccharide transport system permease protein